MPNLMGRLNQAVAAITHHLHQANHKLVNASVIVLLSGLLLFFAFADFNNPEWWPIYWMWDKGKDLLFFASIYVLTTGILKKVFLYILAFLTIRFLWEVAAKIFGQDINNIIAVDLLFYLCLTIIVLISFKDLYQWVKQK